MRTERRLEETLQRVGNGTSGIEDEHFLRTVLIGAGMPVAPFEKAPPEQDDQVVIDEAEHLAEIGAMLDRLDVYETEI